MVAHSTLDRVLLKKYASIAPCHAPYFPLTLLREGFSPRDHRLAAQASNEDPIPKPLSVSLYLSDCHELDGPDACHKTSVHHKARIHEYLGYLEREIGLQAALFDSDRLVEHIHVSGGLSTCMKYAQWERLFGVLAQRFRLAQDDQPTCTIDVDANDTSEGHIALLGELGFTHLNLKVQPSEEALALLVDAARDAYFHAISMTMILAPPGQTLAGFDANLATLIALRPDQLNLCHPRPAGTRTNAAALTPARLQHAILSLAAAGYVHLGLGHFALTDDALAQAWRQGTLSYNLHGYSSHAACDLIGLGPGALSHINDSYSQNAQQIPRYYRHLDQRQPPIWRGHDLRFDDLLRLDIIHCLLCWQWLDVTAIEERYRIVFRNYFAPELTALAPFVEDGLVTIQPDALRLLPPGHLLLGRVAGLFDPPRGTSRRRLSRIV
ncbi:hypothetical protein ACPF7Z_03245 [Halomonas sp. GXIMD04776]|uniref:hypothetical protein n=1 Tax=Halomonas sp. GXIMD04776 TaxID=3415605 RepID=UPI003C9FBB65